MSEFCPPTKLFVFPSKTHRTTAHSSGAHRLFPSLSALWASRLPAQTTPQAQTSSASGAARSAASASSYSPQRCAYLSSSARYRSAPSIPSYVKKSRNSFPQCPTNRVELDFWYEDPKAIAAKPAQDLISVGHLQDLLTDTSPSEKCFAPTVVGRQLHAMLLKVPAFSSTLVRDGLG